MKMKYMVALAIAVVALMPVSAQDTSQAPAAPQAPANRQVPLKVQLTLTRFQGDKKISSVPYMLGVLTNSSRATSLRMGVQVPVMQTVSGTKTESGFANMLPQRNYSYKDVGTNIDCEARDVGNGLFSLNITVEDSTIQLERSPQATEDKNLARDIPSFRSFRSSFAVILRDGQTIQYASATDPITGEVMKVDVMLSLAK